MKQVKMSFAASTTYKAPNPERTAKRNSGEWDVVFQEWPSRAAMLKTIEMQGSRASKQTDWRPLVNAQTCLTCGTGMATESASCKCG